MKGKIVAVLMSSLLVAVSLAGCANKMVVKGSILAIAVGFDCFQKISMKNRA